jgi:hypothetical protein
MMAGCGPAEDAADAPYPLASYSVDFDWSSHQRLAAGSDNWPTTWASDGHHYTVWGDGGGIGGSNTKGRVSLGVARVEGQFENLRMVNVYGGHGGSSPSLIDGKSYGILEVSGRLYMWVGPGSNTDNYKRQTLYFSDDLGLSWSAADWGFTGSDGLANLTFIQYGRGYNANSDNYVYCYAIEIKDPARLQVQTPGEVALLRVKKDSILDRSAYEFFAGKAASGAQTWTDNPSDRKAVFENPAGVGWTLSAIYHPELKQYMLLTEHDVTMKSKLGIYLAPSPWGEWRTAHYDRIGRLWVNRSSFTYNLPSGWLSGNDFVMVFSGVDSNDSWNTVQGTFVKRDAIQ